MAKTNFDQYLERKLEDPEFRKRFEEADRAWDIALQLAALRKARGLTQQQVADLLGTKQQAIARLEDPSYTGHSLSMVKKYAEALGATVQVTITSLDGSLATRSKSEKSEDDVQRALAALEASGLVNACRRNPGNSNHLDGSSG